MVFAVLWRSNIPLLSVTPSTICIFGVGVGQNFMLLLLPKE